jgi:hypothetical protein
VVLPGGASIYETEQTSVIICYLFEMVDNFFIECAIDKYRIVNTLCTVLFNLPAEYPVNMGWHEYILYPSTIKI